MWCRRGTAGNPPRQPRGAAARLPMKRAMLKPPRSLVLVGLMGAGKSAVGRRLATRLALPFVDSDQAIEQAAGMTIESIFETYGEAAFRDVERKIIARLLTEPVQVIATGGGAYVDEANRAVISRSGLAIWLRVGLETLVARTARRQDRPLLKGREARQVLAELMATRDPLYALADITIDSGDYPIDDTVAQVAAAVTAYFDGPHGAADTASERIEHG